MTMIEVEEMKTFFVLVCLIFKYSVWFFLQLAEKLKENFRIVCLGRKFEQQLDMRKFLFRYQLNGNVV